MPKDNNTQYLGDGVYVSYDDYHINIAVNHHTNHVVALDNDVVKRLIEYINYINKTKDNE